MALPTKQPLRLSERFLRHLWVLRLPQAVLAIAIFSIAIRNVKDFQSMACSTPYNMELPIICAALIIIALPYLCLFSYPFYGLRILPRPDWLPTLLDASFLLFYLVVSYYVSSPYAACKDICNACRPMWEEIDGCVCQINHFAEDYKMPLLPSSTTVGVPDGGGTEGYVRRRRMGWIGGLGLSSTILFAFSLSIFLWRIADQILDRNARRAGSRYPRRSLADGNAYESSYELTKSGGAAALVRVEPRSTSDE